MFTKTFPNHAKCVPHNRTRPGSRKSKFQIQGQNECQENNMAADPDD